MDTNFMNFVGELGVNASVLMYPARDRHKHIMHQSFVSTVTDPAASHHRGWAVDCGNSNLTLRQK